MNSNQDSLKILSVSQKQTSLWLKQQVAPSDYSLILGEALVFDGNINIQLFRRSLQQLTEELDVIRAQFALENNQLKQIIQPVYTDEFEFFDLSDEQSPREKADVLMQQKARKKLEVDKDFLWGSILFKLGEQSWLWYQWAHHLSFDGYTGSQAATRLAEIYTALYELKPVPPCQLRPIEEHLEHEQEYLASKHFEKDERYWRELLDKAPDAATLTRRSSEPSGGFLCYTHDMKRALADRVAEKAAEYGCSLPQALISLAAIYYARATGNEELLMATTVSGRVGKAALQQQGMMANVLPLRLKFDTSKTWSSILGQVKSQMTRALRYQRYSFSEMRKLAGMNDPDAQLVRLGINIEPFDYKLKFGDCLARAENISNGSVDDFSIFAFERGDGQDIQFKFEANPGLYDLDEVTEHAKRFMMFIENILAKPYDSLATIPFITEQERHTLLKKWNDTERDFTEKTVPEIISQHAQQTPDAIAVKFKDIQLSFAELEQAANNLCHTLIQQGVIPGDLVAVAIPRSERTIVALLAIMKAGAAYLPLNLQDPASRVSIILEDAEPDAVLITDETNPDLLQSQHRILNLDTLDNVQTDEIYNRLTQDDRAYVIFTSGSTGRPKGVEILHRGVVNLLYSTQEVIGFNKDHRLLAVTTIAFDIAVYELFLPLITGTVTILASDEVIKDPEKLSALIQAEGITYMQATPTLWRNLLQDHLHDLIGLMPSVGGEALAPDLAHKMAQLGNPVYNLYGPTETTVFSTAMELTGAELDHPTIGKPLWNTQTYVLDRNLQLVPPGFEGELYIGGIALATGYLNRPDLTDARFIENPFAQGKMYRTGDIVRWREDGIIDYIGRNDFQVKLKGHRIELGEIEAVCMKHNGIREAVVDLRELRNLGPRLVVYVSLKPDHLVEPNMLLAYLRSNLPTHMVPSICMVMDKLPLNTNGKIDRSALPEPENQLSHTGKVEPRNEREEQLAAIWCDLLELDSVSVTDNFFDLGGDSLLAASMSSKLRTQFSSDIPLARLLQKPTIENLAELMDSNTESGSTIDAVIPIRTEGKNAPVFCIHPLTGLGWGFHSLTHSLDPNTPIYALQADGLRDVTLLPESIEAMASSYIKRIKQLRPHGPYNLIGWSLGGLVAHEMAYQLEANGEEVSFLGLLDSYPFYQAKDIRCEQDLADGVMKFLGYESDSVTDLNSLKEYCINAFASENPEFIEQITLIDPEFMNRAEQSIMKKLDLVFAFRPKQVNCEVHLFRAAKQEGTEVLKNIMDYDANAWLKHTGKNVHVLDINCNHQQMLDMEPAREIGSVVSKKLLAIS